MPNTTTHLFLLAFLVVLALRPAPTRAQQRVATHIDSVRAARDANNPKDEVQPVTLTFVSGKRTKAWLGDNTLRMGTMDGYVSCFLDRVDCYETDPAALPRPLLKTVQAERLSAIEVKGPTKNNRFVALHNRRGKPLGILAENLAKPGPMELFGYAKTKNDMLIPVPLPGVVFLIPTGTHEKYFWYVRLAGGELHEVPGGNGEMTEFMAQLCRSAPALVADLQRRNPRPYHLKDLPDIVNHYNAIVGPDLR